MTNRITGTNSGIDVDTVVKQSLSTQQNKIDKAYQQQKVYEYQQAQLKVIVQQAQDFYDKYLDVSSSKNLLLTAAYQTLSFTSTTSTGAASTAVTAKGFAGADVGKYSVVVDKMATSAKVTLKSDELSEVSNGGVIAIKMKDSNGKDVLAYADVAMTSGGEIDMSTTAKNLTTSLNKAGINVSAKYSDFTKGITLESGELGENVEFQVAVTNKTSAADLAAKSTTEEKISLLGGNDAFKSDTPIKGTNAQGTITKDGQTYRFDQKSNVVTVDNVQFTINSVTPPTTENKPSGLEHLKSDTTEAGVKVLLEQGDLVTTKVGGNVISTSKTYDDGIIVTKGIDSTTVKGDLTALSESDKNITNKTEVENSDGSKTITLESEDGRKTVIKKDKDGKVVSKETTKVYTDGTEIKSVVGADGKIKTTAEKIGFGEVSDADATKKTITSKDEKTQTIIEKGEDGNEKITTTQVQNDGSEIKLVGNDTEVTKSEAIILTGETDVTGLKDTIVNFVNDYNSLMQSINDKLWETRDKDYMPLTEEQKSEMSESEIEAWEKKAQTGLLKNDSDLKRIQSAMKSAMSSMMSGTGLTLESIGIKPVDNYTTKNGTFTIDEDKLTKALQENGANVKDLFIRSASGSDKGGVLTQLQSTLRSEFKASSSSLSQKIGFSGTSTESSNTLSKNITAQKKLITELKDRYSTKETALYNKYSALEVMLEKLNAQSNSLYSMLGLSS
ncbi:flagellar filament capping protein FliD [Clostridium butyricum]|uniref:flagellar filament capping protein FliD n=1 Tax=Clostridium butyricum TaxID=1492 RepID=UPI0024B9D433|nr:flagellar filament capping protein FliD [Clostridium butyricum]